MILRDQFYQDLDKEEKLLITIWETSIKNETCYYGKYVNVNLQIYKDYAEKNMPEQYGMHFTERTNGPVVYYKDLNELKHDIREALIKDHRLKSQL